MPSINSVHPLFLQPVALHLPSAYRPTFAQHLPCGLVLGQLHCPPSAPPRPSPAQPSTPSPSGAVAAGLIELLKCKLTEIKCNLNEQPPPPTLSLFPIHRAHNEPACGSLLPQQTPAVENDSAITGCSCAQLSCSLPENTLMGAAQPGALRDTCPLLRVSLAAFGPRRRA